MFEVRKKPLRVIVCGSRGWHDAVKVQTILGRFLSEWREAGSEFSPDKWTVVHGGAQGADQCAHYAAKRLGAKTEEHAANWQSLGKRAGPARNEEMAGLGARLCLAFWDGKSRGTLDMIIRAVKHGIPVRIIPPKPPRT